MHVYSVPVLSSATQLKNASRMVGIRKGQAHLEGWPSGLRRLS